MEQPQEKLRVGDPDAPIFPGDYSPSGGFYRQGQFAPSLDELSTLSLTQALEAGLINKNLPIFEGDKVSEELLKKWNPNGELYGVHFEDDIPKYSSAVIVDALQNSGNLTDILGMKFVTGGERYTQDSMAIAGEIIIAADYSSKGRKFKGILRVFPSFYKYVSTPLIGMIPGRTSGLSIASYAVFHSLGHIFFAKLSFGGRLDLIGDLIEMSGWSKYNTDETLPGSYMNIPNKSTWRRSSTSRFPTETSRYSPSDDFAEAFALYITNRDYLESAYPERFELIQNALREHGYVL